jgi:branched-chain amino acid transport system substrate-binding protein
MIRSARAFASLAATAAILLVPLTPSPGEAQSPNVIRFGASLALTGGLASEGTLVKDGYDWMVKTINDRGGITVGGKKYTVEIKYYDDGSDTPTAVRLTKKLLDEDHVNFLLGPYGSGATNATSAVAEQYKIPMVDAHGSANTIYSKGNKYIFGVLNPADQYATPMLQLAKEQKDAPKTIAFIREDTLFANIGIESAAKQAEAMGMKVVYNEKYPSGTKDFSTIIAAIKAQKPDMVLAGGYQGDMIVITRQIREGGLGVKMLGFLLGPTVRGYVGTLGALAEGTLEPTQWNSNMGWHDQWLSLSSEQFSSAFEKEYHYVPDYHAPQSAAALEVFYNAIRKANSLDPQKVRDTIASSPFESFYGPIKFNEGGINVGKTMACIQIQHVKTTGTPEQQYLPVPVWPAKLRGSAHAIYPLK